MKTKDKLFNVFNGLRGDLEENSILEISVKQDQISLLLKEPMLNFKDFSIINDYIEKGDVYTILTQEQLYVMIDDPVFSEKTSSPFAYLMQIIQKMAEEICTCPVLEYSVTDTYIKCFLDKPGLKIDDLHKYEEILEVVDDAELELHTQRPYLLFINMNQNI